MSSARRDDLGAGAAGADRQRRHALAHAQALDALPQGAHGARGLKHRYERQFHLREPGGEERIDEAQPGVGDIDGDLAGARCGHLLVGDGHGGRSVVAGCCQCSHWDPP